MEKYGFQHLIAKHHDENMACYLSRLLIAALFVAVLAFNVHSFPKLVYDIQLPVVHGWPGGDLYTKSTAIVFVDKAGRMIVESDDASFHGIDTIAANDYPNLDKHIATITQAASYPKILIYADKTTKYSVIAKLFNSIADARGSIYGWRKIHIVVRLSHRKCGRISKISSQSIQ